MWPNANMDTAKPINVPQEYKFEDNEKKIESFVEDGIVGTLQAYKT